MSRKTQKQRVSVPIYKTTRREVNGQIEETRAHVRDALVTLSSAPRKPTIGASKITNDWVLPATRAAVDAGATFPLADDPCVASEQWEQNNDPETRIAATIAYVRAFEKARRLVPTDVHFAPALPIFEAPELQVAA